MAPPPKRKRGIARAATPVRTRKRVKAEQRSPHPHGEVDYERDYKVRKILQENDTHYEIDWENDEVTGERYQPTWEPKENANVAAVIDWERRKRSNALSSAEQKPAKFTLKLRNPRKTAPLLLEQQQFSGSATSRAARKTQSKAPPEKSASPITPASTSERRPRGRPRRIIVDSSPISDSSQQLIDELAQSQILSQPVEIGESQQSSRSSDQSNRQPVSVPISSTQPIAAVQLSDPPSSFLAGAYERIITATRSPQNAASGSSEPVSGGTNSQTLDSVRTSAHTATSSSQESQSLELEVLAVVRPASQQESQQTNGFTHTLTPSAGTPVVHDSQASQPRSFRSISDSASGESRDSPDSPHKAYNEGGSSNQAGIEVLTEQSNIEASTTSFSSIADPDNHIAFGSLHTHLGAEQQDRDAHLRSDRNATEGSATHNRTHIPSSRLGASQTYDQDLGLPKAALISHQSSENETRTLEQGQVKEFSSEHNHTRDTYSPASNGSHARKKQTAIDSSSSYSAGRERSTGSRNPKTRARQQNHRPTSPTSLRARLTSETLAQAIVPDQSLVTSSLGYIATPAVGKEQQQAPDNLQDLSTNSEAREQARLREYTAAISEPPLPLATPRRSTPDTTALHFAQQLFDAQISRQSLSGADKSTVSDAALVSPSANDRQGLVSQSGAAFVAKASARPVTALEEYAQERAVNTASTGPRSAFLTQVPFSQGFRAFGSVSQTPISPAPKTLVAQTSGLVSGVSWRPIQSSSAPTSLAARDRTISQSRSSTPESGSSLLQSFRAIRQRNSARARENLTTSRSPSADVANMDNSAPSSSTDSFADRLRAMRAAKKVESNSNDASAFTPAHPSEQPASAIPPSLSVEIAKTLPGRSVSPALQDMLRSPSAVPAVAPEEVVTLEDQNTSERYPTLLPQALDSSPILHRPNAISAAIENAQGQHEQAQHPDSAGAHVLPVILVGHQRDQYSQEVYHHKDIIIESASSSALSSQSWMKAQQFVDRLRKTVIHPDLINPETATQHTDEPERQARWDIDCSSKFRFLHRLLTDLREHNLEVAVVAYGRQLCDMIETFLTGIHVPYVRSGHGSPDYALSQEMRTALLVNIVDLDIPDQHRPADVVISMDSSVRQCTTSIESLRKRKKNERSPFLTMVVPYSVEHIDRCLATSMPTQARVRALIRGIDKYKPSVANLSDVFLRPDEAAAAVARYIIEGADWPLTHIGVLEDLDSQTDSEFATGSNETASRHAEEESEQSNQKRHADLEITASSPATKRPRLDDVGMEATINPQDLDVTHVSDSLGTYTYDNSTLAFDKGMDESVSVERLWAKLYERQARIDALEEALGGVQYRLEAERMQLVARTKERDSEIASKQVAQERVAKLDAQNAILRNEKVELKEQIDDLRMRLQSHSIPEHRELEKLRLDLERSRAEIAKAEKRVEATEGTLRYTRELYQTSSNVAAELTQEMNMLRSELAEVQRIASDKQAQARGITNDMREMILQKENKKLRAQLADREHMISQMQKREMVSRGRIGTRASSGARGSRAPSRQSSPSAAAPQTTSGPMRAQHPLRNEN